MNNSIFSIKPYLHYESPAARPALVFDDSRVGLVKEPFVANADVLLLAMATSILGRDTDKFTVVFSSRAFPGHHYTLSREKSEYGGAWYRWDQLDPSKQDPSAIGWLCPALFLYFTTAPKTIYIQIKEW
jgi:hypothetical protein